MTPTQAAQTKKNIGSLFDRIAPSYDKFNHVTSLNIDRYWRQYAVKQMHKHQQVLDVAIGTADLAIEMLRQGKATHVQGIDLSQEMMTIGKQKAERFFAKQTDSQSLSVDFMLANAQAMPFDDNSFDAVTCAFGVRNFADLDAGLKEMHRVMKKDGELLILEFSYPTNLLIRWGYNLYFSYVLPLIGRLMSKDKKAYTYLNQSVKQFPYGEKLVERLKKAGFDNITFQPLTFGIATLYQAH
ncbi:MAG: bifunctional demethylmenaquinone methyltransferase/2-methoxy-6-polyprenyl-1,4-benzoquinol methylase UbiE [Paludibacteraceae bacterium]|nr:bifunctional demethylmenaquinone methyltransferase/2-methoxy-6-polyprenyl-1,4-benzoquinol methylase UbiE [Paludibacteraceae bacterium]